MNTAIRIRKALSSDLERLKRLNSHDGNDSTLAHRLIDACVLVAESGHRLRASSGIDLDRSEIRDLYIEPASINGKLGRRIIQETEKLAASFGIFSLRIRSEPPFSSLLRSCGYTSEQADIPIASDDTQLHMQRSFPRRRTRYSRTVARWFSELGIAPEYSRYHRIPLQQEAISLKKIGLDIYQREQKMLPGAADAWLTMCAQAERSDVLIQAVSAFRSVAYQAGLVRRKVDNGLSIEEILRVSAAPGFSEHHTGRAIDITTPGYPVLEESFESSPAFRWLQTHAAEFGFHLSFPRGNRHNLSYEPWHWAWSGSQESAR